MLYSMTGFGRSEASLEGKQITIEIRSLNGKQFELNSRIPSALRHYEGEIRKQLQTAFVRGTVELHLSLRQDGASRPMTINLDMARFYHQHLRQMARTLDMDVEDEDLFPLLVNLPEVVAPEQESLSESLWNGILPLLQQAVDQVNEHRAAEGKVLEQDLQERIQEIRRLLHAIDPLEKKREERIRQRISQALNERLGKDQVDENRFEQEMIYYLEKIDFSEEKTRLLLHCDYFEKTLGEPELAKGKLLGFILQEIGREINTLGSKAQLAEIQQKVVQMKEELEKAKEQVLNIL